MTDKKNNLELWNAVFETNPSHTSDFNKGYKGTAIKPYYVIQRATERWGAIGMAWRVIEVDRQIVNDCVYMKVRVETPEGSAEHWGGETLDNYKGTGPDDEAFKKAYTDAFMKALSLFGFSADVHLNMFSDSKYKEYLDRKYEEENTKASIKRRLPDIDGAVSAIESQEGLDVFSILLERIWPLVEEKMPDYAEEINSRIERKING